MGGISTQPTLKRNLKATLAKRSDAAAAGNNMAGVQVSYGFPKSPAKEFVILTDIRDDGEHTATYGATTRSREENYSLFVIVKVEKQTTDQEATTDRAYAIAGEIETALRTDPTQSVPNLLWALIAGVGLQEFGNDQTRMAVLTIRVQCKARI